MTHFFYDEFIESTGNKAVGALKPRLPIIFQTTSSSHLVQYMHLKME